MRRRRSRSALDALDRRLLIVLLVFLVVGTVTINCTRIEPQSSAADADLVLESAGIKAEEPLVLTLDPEEQKVLSTGELWVNLPRFAGH
jgi:hypothetical protein